MPSKTTLLIAGALFMMSVSADCGTPTVTCETSDGSPSYDDADRANNYWRQIADGSSSSCGDSGCAQPHGSGCHDSAKIVMCQDDSSSSTAVCGDCTCIGGYLQTVLDQCQSNGKVGGYAHVSEGGSYINYEFVHS